MSDANPGARTRLVGGVGLIVLLATAGSLLARSASSRGLVGFALVTAGVVALLLVSYPLRDIAAAGSAAVSLPDTRAASRRAARVWEAAARSAWLLSALLAVVGFVRILCSDPGGLDRFLGAVGEGAAGVTWGVVLAALCAFPALRLTRLAEHLGEERSPAPLAPGRWERLLGYLLFVLLAAWSFVGSGGGPSFRPEQWTLHGPAWLMVGGGALALALYLQETRSGGAFTPGFAVAGAIGGIVGLTQALHGFLMTRIEDVAGGLAFAISSCCAALVGLATIGMPLEDRSFAADPGGAPHAATRWAWYGFPVLAVLLLALTILLVMVPIERKLG